MCINELSLRYSILGVYKLTLVQYLDAPVPEKRKERCQLMFISIVAISFTPSLRHHRKIKRANPAPLNIGASAYNFTVVSKRKEGKRRQPHGITLVA